MDKPFSVIFAGTPQFAVPSLEALQQDERFDITLVVTQPDRPVGRKQFLTPSPVKVCAEKYKLPVVQPQNINEYTFQDVPCDFLVIVAYGQLLQQHVLDVPKIAPVNVHPSLLPRWRGATPIQAAILANDTKTGVSVQLVAKKMDAGDIIGQKEVPILETQTSVKLHEMLFALGAELLVQTLTAPLEPKPQDENQITVCKKLSRTDGEVDPSTMTADEIDRHVRALVPWPGVTCPIDGNKVKLLQTSLQPVTGAIELPCASNTILYIQQLQIPGKKPTQIASSPERLQ